MNRTEEILCQIVHEQVIVAMRDDGIVHVTFLPNTEITVEFQEILADLYNQITLGKKSLLYF